MKVKIKLGEGACVPKKAHPHDAGYDICTSEDVLLKCGYYEGKRYALPTQLSIELPLSCTKWYWKILKWLGVDTYVYGARIVPRSGLSLKGMVGCTDSRYRREYRYDCDVNIGLVDQNYRDPMGVLVTNRDDQFFIPKGTKVAQMTIERFYVADFEVCDELSPSERDGGFGTSGTR